jgi:hypothetical protein
LFDLAARFFIPTHGRWRRRAQEPRQGWRVSATARLVLDGSEHDGTIAVVGDDDIEGSPLWGCAIVRATSLYAVGTETQTMMQ